MSPERKDFPFILWWQWSCVGVEGLIFFIYSCKPRTGFDHLLISVTLFLMKYLWQILDNIQITAGVFIQKEESATHNPRCTVLWFMLQFHTLRLLMRTHATSSFWVFSRKPTAQGALPNDCQKNPTSEKRKGRNGDYFCYLLKIRLWLLGWGHIA